MNTSVRITGGKITASGNGIGGYRTNTVLSYRQGATADDICIRSAAYTGAVTLESSFMAKTETNSRVFFEGETYTNSQLENTVLVPLVYDWEMVQALLNAGTERITLTNDITAKEEDSNAGTPADSWLVVPEGKTVTIDLNGHTINRNHNSQSPTEDGTAIYVKEGATLTIVGDGTIKGGNSNKNGGGILNEGTLTMEGGTITECHAYGGGGGIYSTGTLTLNDVTISNNEVIGYGGGICLFDGGTLNLCGGTITGNRTTIGGAVYVDGTAGMVNIKGSPAISENEAVEEPAYGEFFLSSGKVLTVTGPLTNDIPITVYISQPPSASAPVVITSGLKGKGDASRFASGSTEYIIGLNPDGEAILGTRATVTFDAGETGAAGTMDTVAVASGGVYVLADNGFTAPEGMQFTEWSVKVS